MKKLLTFASAALLAASVQAQDVQLVVEQIDNLGLVQGNTYRVYAELPSNSHSLHAVFAEAENPVSIQTEGTLFNHQYGGYASAEIYNDIITLDETLAHDSWITINAENNTANDLWDIGMDFSTFESSGNLDASDGAWFIIPTDEMAKPVQGNLVLLMQLTVDGTVSGSLNLQGWDADQTPWQVRNATFETTNSHTFGCTSAFADNYNQDATYDDGTCEEADTDPSPTLSALVAGKLNDSFTVTPNPVVDNNFNIVFKRSIDDTEGDLMVDILDATGKLISTEQIPTTGMLNGSMHRVNTELAAGVYSVTVRNNVMSQSIKILKR